MDSDKPAVDAGFAALDRAAAQRRPWPEIDAALRDIAALPGADHWTRSECAARRLFLAAAYRLPVADRDAMLREARPALEEGTFPFRGNVTVDACADDAGMLLRHLPSLRQELEEALAAAPHDEKLLRCLQRVDLHLERARSASSAERGPGNVG